MRGTGRWQRLGALTVTAAILLTGCWWGGDDDDEGDATTTTVADMPAGEVDPIVTVEGAGLDTGRDTAALGVRLSEGTPAGEVEDSATVVDGTPLGSADIAALFARLPEWIVPGADQVDFNRPPATLLPPLVGDTIEAPFPPADDGGGPEAPATGPLEVLRFQPEGEVGLAPFISVTFDHPMVPLATLDQLDATDVPVRVTPAIEGRWRWIGTRTLRFELVPDVLDRLPAATSYRVEVPAGTVSADGARLAETVSWTFTTPTPTVNTFAGESTSLPLDPVFVAVFDQRVDSDAVLGVTTLDVDGDDWPIRAATAAEIDADEHARTTADGALDDRAVAFVPGRALPADAALRINIGPNVPSAEGPLVAPGTTTFAARTFGQLEIERRDCNGGAGCIPGAPFTVTFSNPLDPEAFRADQIEVDPGIPGMRVNVYGTVVEVHGATEGQTTYTVRFAADLTDVYGQTLGEDATVEFRVGSSPPVLNGLQRQYITTDPGAETPLVSVTTINHESIRVLAWAVTPADLGDFRNYVDRQFSDEDAAPPEWQAVLDEVVEIDAEQDRYAETAIDLTAAFDQAGSQLVVRVEPTARFFENDDDYWLNRPTVAWVQRTTLGIDAILDSDELLIWTTDLVTGEPMGGVPVELIGDGRIATTDAEGIARLDVGDTGVLGLWAAADDRTSFLPSDWWQGWERQTDDDEGRWYVFDDRGIYKPGETVRITGWVRQFRWSEDAQLALYGDGASVTYRVFDPQGSEIGTGSVDLNALGGFNLAIDLPEGANLGQAFVELTLDGLGSGFASTGHSFEIQEFRTPEFEVTARNESPAPHYAARPATVAVDAEYFAGGPLPDAEVNWLVTTRDTTYSPPNWDDFIFGIWQPWWYFGGFEGDVGFARDVAVESDICFDCGPVFDATYEEFSGRTDAGGTHYLQIDFDGPDVDLPTTVTAEATVFDVNRQAWASRTDLLVHAAEYYVGLRSDRTFVERGTPIRIDAVVTDVDGSAIAGREVDITAGRLEWGYTDGQWSEQLVDETTCTITSSGDASDGSMRCEFTTEVGGTYRITAIVTDDEGHRNRTELTQWVSGGEGRPTRNVEQEAVTIVPDRETYAPGDTAELLVQAPFAPAHGIATVIRHGIVTTEAFEAEDGSAIIAVPIEDAYIPNITVQVDMVGSAQRTADDGTPLPDLPDRPAFATGQIGLSIPPVTRALEVTATPADTALEPGGQTSVTVEVLGPDGEPVSGADVAVVVVDEAVLSLTGYELTDPLDVFYGDVWSNVYAQYIRSSILLNRSDLVEGSDGEAQRSSTEAGASVASDDAASDEAAAEEPAADFDTAGGGDSTAIDLRTNFEALALYAPEETTGAAGTVTVDVPLPDSLTRYRVMAVAIDGADHFGKGESTITARLPLQVRPSAPRFLNYGDRFELPVVLQNQTDEPIEVDVAVQVANLALTGSAGRRVTVPANDRVEVRFPAATDQAGTARLRVAAASGSFADAAQVELPVYTPATAEAFATYGVVDDGPIGQPLLAPTGVFPQFGGLEIDTSSTALQALTDAVLYLYEYRYESADGLASRIMAVAALRDVLAAFSAEGLPDEDELNAQVGRDIAALAALQNNDGGFPYWQRGRQSIPWQSIQATHALVLADEAGFSVPADTIDRALDHLASIEEYFPSDYGENVRNTLSAYALHVRAEAGRQDTVKATALYESVGDDLELDAVAWLWPSIVDTDLRAEIERRFQNSAVETAGAATFATSYDEGAYVIANSERKTDGIILDALVTQTPESDLIPKVVTGLLGHQTRGRWNNAHENAFILLALHRYFDTFESVTPDFVARAWLGDLYAAEHEYRGRTTDRASSLVPMSAVIGGGDSNVVIAKNGEGRLYYRLGLRYAPDDLVLDPRDEGFVVDRVYEAIDDTADVSRNADGTWQIRAGAKVLVKLTMVADARRTHVALIDPLPAGLEPINPALAVSETTPPPTPTEETFSWWWGWNWFEHQNLRDDRAEAFTSYLPGGTYEYTYVARATTPGEFVVPPARAEEIYAPDVFGRSASAIVVIG